MSWYWYASDTYSSWFLCHILLLCTYNKIALFEATLLIFLLPPCCVSVVFKEKSINTARIGFMLFLSRGTYPRGWLTGLGSLKGVRLYFIAHVLLCWHRHHGHRCPSPMSKRSTTEPNWSPGVFLCWPFWCNLVCSLCWYSMIIYTEDARPQKMNPSCSVRPHISLIGKRNTQVELKNTRLMAPSRIHTQSVQWYSHRKHRRFIPVGVRRFRQFVVLVLFAGPLGDANISPQTWYPFCCAVVIVVSMLRVSLCVWCRRTKKKHEERVVWPTLQREGPRKKNPR